MKVEEAIQTRRSIKHYDPEFEMPEHEIQKLLSLALLSPTAFNIQNWRFIDIRDSELRNQIRKHAKDQAQITDASVLLALCGDLKAWGRDPGKYWKTAPEDVQEALAFMIEQYYVGRDQAQRDEAFRSCGIAAMTLMLAAKEMGYDSCPMDLFDFDEVAKLIDLPDDHVLVMLLAIGKGIQEPWPRGGQLDLNEVSFVDRFPAG